MADRSISISLEAKVQGFVAGMKTAQQATNDFASRTASFARENEQHLDRVGKASMVMGGALLAGVGLAVKSFMDFDSAMSEVRASTHETSGNMDLLREAAINAGADTAFSAAEAAKGIDELAKAGVSTKDILGGGLAGALSLAAAGSLGVGDAAEIAATALTQFKLSGKDIPHLADLLAAGAGKAQGSVEDMGSALKQSGLVASQFGLSVEDTTGTLAAFASAGLIGSDAGTSLKTMLLKLASPSKEAAGMMDELGIAAYDSAGKFVGVTNLAGQLKDKLGGLTQAQRDSTLATIFGTDAIRGANVLYESGAQGIADWTEKVNDAGYAAVTASIKQDNLAGDLEKLGGSFDSVLIKGGKGVAESLRGMVQGAEDLVDALGKIPAPILNAGVGIAGIAGGALLLTGAIASGLPKFLEFKSSLDEIAPAGSKARGGIDKVAKGAGLAVGALVALQVAAAVFTEKHTKSAEDYGQAILRVAKASEAARGAKLDELFSGFDVVAGQAVSKVDSLSGAVERLTHQNFNDAGNKFFEGFTSLIGLPKGEIGQLEDRLKGLGDEMGNLARNGAGETAAKTFQALTKEFEKNGKGAQEALDALPGYKEALQGLAKTAGVALEGQDLLDFALGKIPASMQKAQGATETYTTSVGNTAPVTEAMAESLDEVGLSAEGAVVDIDAFGKSLFAAGLLSLSASDASIAYQDAIDKVTASVTKNGTTLDINTEAGRANQSAFNGLAQAAITSAEASAKETLATQGSAAAQKQLQDGLGQSYTDLIKAAGQFGITGDAADTMARKALGIPKNVNIETWIADHASATLDGIKRTTDGLDGRKVTIGVNTVYTETGPKPDGYVVQNGVPAYHATGGRVNYLAGGGQPILYDMQPQGTDTVPTMLTPGEFVVNREDTAKNLSLLQAINSGRQYQPAAAPARQMAMAGVAPAVNVAAPAVTVMIGNEQLDARMFSVADSAIGQANRRIGRGASV